MKTPPRILFAGLFHETHTFLESRTGLADFTTLEGEAMLSCSGDSSPMGGALEQAARLGWLLHPALDMRAVPSATVEDAVFAHFWERLHHTLQKAVASGLDGIFLVLHGAMVCTSHPDVEGELLERIRSVPGAGQLPVFGVFDLHANFTQRMAVHSDGLVAYRENPHTDAREAAQRAVHLLERSLRLGHRPRTLWKHPPILWPPTGTGSASDPMRALLALARSWEERHPQLWCVNIVAGFSFADTPDTGVSFSVISDGDTRTAEACLGALASEALALRDLGNSTESPAHEVLARALAEPCEGLTVIAEPSDNIGGGAPGDGTGLLRVFLELQVPRAALAIADALAVSRIRNEARSHPAAPFPVLALTVGGRGSSLDAGPVTLDVEVLSLHDGRFELADKNSHLASLAGDYFEMGPCAVVRHGELTLLLTSKPTPPMDLGQWTSQGLDPRSFSYLGVKAAVAHRRAYDPIAARMLWADTPGPCTSNLNALPYSRIHRPVFPLDALPADPPISGTD